MSVRSNPKWTRLLMFMMPVLADGLEAAQRVNRLLEVSKLCVQELIRLYSDRLLKNSPY